MWTAPGNKPSLKNTHEWAYRPDLSGLLVFKLTDDKRATDAGTSYPRSEGLTMTAPSITARFVRRMLATVAIGAVVTAGISACSALPESPQALPESADSALIAPEDVILASYGLEGLDAREVIDTLDALPLDERPQTLMASVRPDELLLMDDSGAEGSVPMPEDEFYVSIAPYMAATHECYFHSLTTCTAELQGEAVDVLITDTATGEVLLDGPVTTFDNGFVGLWLPRGIQAEITIEYDGLSATSALNTQSADDATCITTMQLT